ncbi:Steryl-sulfatase [Chionoecetes opilio]|uniref:Steryl-sulfatase n=1 Tax=Chionoecetes opilio TaxID=41210 RepID=A0A8J4YFP0_CHIOP|nr:Steryl-sulfatase [Chionoecetes opilio]
MFNLLAKETSHLLIGEFPVFIKKQQGVVNRVLVCDPADSGIGFCGDPVVDVCAATPAAWVVPVYDDPWPVSHRGSSTHTTAFTLSNGGRLEFLCTTPLAFQVSPWMDRHLNTIVMEDEVVVQQPVVLQGVSQLLASHSVSLIARYAREERPFFLYHSFLHTHTPMFTVPEMAGRSAHGRYGDNVEEMDASVGEILTALREHDLQDNTIVYFLSDHGGNLEALAQDGQREGGHNGLFKGGKGMGGAEGGIRVPGIFRWPGHIPAGVTLGAATSLLDTLPTLLDLAGLPPLHDLMAHLPHRVGDAA